jgi:hypothetical protein
MMVSPITCLAMHENRFISARYDRLRWPDVDSVGRARFAGIAEFGRQLPSIRRDNLFGEHRKFDGLCAVAAILDKSGQRPTRPHDATLSTLMTCM